MSHRRDESTDTQLLLTAEEAARALNIGRTTLYALLKDGRLRSVHIGRCCRLTRAELLRYVEQLDSSAGTVTPSESVGQAALFDPDPPEAA